MFSMFASQRSLKNSFSPCVPGSIESVVALDATVIAADLPSSNSMSSSMIKALACYRETPPGVASRSVLLRVSLERIDTRL